jgi:hypothetical protein
MINKNLFLAKSFVDQGIVSVSNFLIIIFSANVLIPQQHGLLSLIIASLIAIQSITIPLISWGSFLYLKQENNPIIYQKILAALSLIIAVIFSIIFICVAIYLDFFINIEVLIIASMFIFFQLLTDHVRLEFYTFKIGGMPIWNSSLVYISRLVGLYFVSDLHELLLVLLLSNVFSFPKFLNLFSFNIFKNSDFINRALKHIALSKNMTLSSLLNWSWNYLPIFYIGMYHDVALSGILLSLKSLANIHYPLSNLLDTFVPSLLYNRQVVDIDRFLSKVLYASLGIWCFVFVVLFFYSTQILAFIFGDLYQQFNYILIILWLSSGVVLFAKNKIILARWDGKLSLETIASGSSLVVVVIIGLPLVKYFALQGAVLLYLIATIVYLIAILLKNHKIRK